MHIEIGDYVRIQKGTTNVRGQIMGWRVDNGGEISELFIDGFYVGFDIGEPHWLIIDDTDLEEEDDA